MNRTSALSLLKQAESRLRHAKLSLKERDYAFCVRLSQECVELSLKACLRLVGVDYPKEHDVREVILREANRFPKEFAEKAEELANISSFLARQRDKAMYGDEEKGLGPGELFDKESAEEALKQAELVYNCSHSLLKRWK